MASLVLTIRKVQICRIFTNKHNNRNQLLSRCDKTPVKTLQNCSQLIFIKTSAPPPICDFCVTVCKAGSSGDGATCSLCVEGTYQPNEGQTSCLSCDMQRVNSTTEDRGSTDGAACGEYLFNCEPPARPTDTYIHNHDHNAKLAIHENNGLTIGNKRTLFKTFITHC